MDSTLVVNILRALLRWWWLIILSVALSVGVAYLLRTEQVDLYQSSASIIVGRDPNNPVQDHVATEVLDGYVVLMRRSNILQPVIDELNLGITVSQLLERMQIQPDTLTSLINVTVIDTDPDRAAKIANRIAEEMIFQTSDRQSQLGSTFVNEQIESTQQQILELQREYSALIDEAANLTSAFELQQNIDQRESIDLTVQQLRVYLINLVENAPRSDLALFESAVPDHFPIASNSYMDLVFAGGGGGVLAIAMIVLFTFFDDRILWDDKMRDSILGQKILGPLAVIPKNKLPLYVNTMSDAIETEALRQVRAKIILGAGGNFPQVLTVLSYDSGDGKTLTSSNLAMETANAGLRTLVIDGDMRRGDLHEIFHMPNIFGLSDILAGTEPVSNLVWGSLIDGGYNNLTVMPYGRATNDPAALVASRRFSEMIDLLRPEFDAIIIDAAPTIAGSDSVFMGENSDGVVIVVNTRRTRLPSLQRTIDSLEEGRDIRILGVIFNRVRIQITARYYNYYYRQTPGLKPSRVMDEMNNPRTGIAVLWANIILDKSSGERLFSIPAAAARLGVRKSTVQDWITQGHLQTERRGFRRWVRKSRLDGMLDETLSRANATATTPAQAGVEEDEALRETENVNGGATVADAISRREAILGYASQPDSSNSEA